jgi:hypothetical protein
MVIFQFHTPSQKRMHYVCYCHKAVHISIPLSFLAYLIFYFYEWFIKDELNSHPFVRRRFIVRQIPGSKTHNKIIYTENNKYSIRSLYQKIVYILFRGKQVLFIRDNFKFVFTIYSRNWMTFPMNAGFLVIQVPLPTGFHSINRKCQGMFVLSYLKLDLR